MEVKSFDFHAMPNASKRCGPGRDLGDQVDAIGDGPELPDVAQVDAGSGRNDTDSVAISGRPGQTGSCRTIASHCPASKFFSPGSGPGVMNLCGTPNGINQCPGKVD